MTTEQFECASGTREGDFLSISTADPDDGEIEIVIKDGHTYSHFLLSPNNKEALALMVLADPSMPLGKESMFKSPEVLASECSYPELQYYAWLALRAAQIQREEELTISSGAVDWDDESNQSLGLALYKKETKRNPEAIQWGEADMFAHTELVRVDEETRRAWIKKALTVKLQQRGKSLQDEATTRTSYLLLRRTKLSKARGGGGAGFMYLPDQDKRDISKLIEAEISLGLHRG